MKTIQKIQAMMHPFWHFPFTSLLLFTLNLMGSCDSFIEVDLPKSQLTKESVFKDYRTADAALVDIYAKIRDNGLLSGSNTGLSCQLGNYADELICFGNPSDPALPFYNNTLLPSNATITEYWNVTYNQIYAANAVLEGSRGSSSLSSADKEKLVGEALFIRALLHFYLVNLFGDIPYITSTDYKSNSTASKESITEVYKHIESDLQAAAALIPVAQTSTRTRPGKSAVLGLLSRVYLYKGSWNEASNSASSVLNDTGMYNLEETDRTFLKDSRETIWQLQPATVGKNADEAGSFIFLSGPPPLVSLRNELMDSFSANDLRKSHWTQAVSEGTLTWYHAYKYKKRENTPVSVEYPIVFRLAEQYLIRAEARAHIGDVIGSAEDLNAIRHRAGLGDTPANNQKDLLDAIYQERRLEMFTEYGHRFFDLKRSGKINAALLGIKPGWKPTDVLFPLPQRELALNQNLLPQNDGY